MKQFSCGDVVPGCTKTFTAAGDDELLRAVAAHALADHGLADIPPSLLAAVHENIRTVAS